MSGWNCIRQVTIEDYQKLDKAFERFCRARNINHYGTEFGWWESARFYEFEMGPKDLAAYRRIIRRVTNCPNANGVSYNHIGY